MTTHDAHWLEGISPTQMRMARAALGWTMADLGQALAISKMAVSRYESGNMDVLGMATVLRAKALFLTHGLFFGPRDGVCVGVDVFASERWLSVALHQLLTEQAIQPTSAELLAAYQRATPPRRKNVQ